MSFLTPFYVLGALSIAAPILFHLIRRTTKGEVPFGSLIFLTPSPPKLTRRSRIDQWLLLLLRAAALILIALAFARPFLRESANLSLEPSEQSRTLLLIDNSASMKRGDLWSKALGIADQVLSASQPGDQIAVYSFNDTSDVILSFDESATVDPSRRRAIAKGRLDRLAPTWRSTNLGQALIDAVGAIEGVGDASRKTSDLPRRVILISDLQAGSRLDALGHFEWPSDVAIDLKTVAADGSNASLQWLAKTTEGEPSAEAGAMATAVANEFKVRVANDAGSTRESFELTWKGDGRTKPIPAYVAPGESRVVRVPALDSETGVRASTRRTLQLSGDTQDFDNTLYLASEPREDATVVFLGDDKPDDPSGLLYYLDRVFADTARRHIKVEARSATSPLTIVAGRAFPLVVLGSETSPANLETLRSYLQNGGTVVIVARGANSSGAIAGLLGLPALTIEEGVVKGDLMLGAITFDHLLFAPFAAPQFNDFTKIRFWKYRRIAKANLEAAQIVASFENGDPAIIEKRFGAGRLYVLTSGWNPSDSQLARSTKFVPLMATLLQGSRPETWRTANHLVSEPVDLPENARSVIKPDGTTIPISSGTSRFRETDQPGIYTVETSVTAEPSLFAVNLDPLESKTTPLPPETLEQFGCKLTNAERRSNERDAARQLLNAELEGRQKLWRWLIITVLSILIVETWLSGRLSRTRPTLAEAPA